MDRIVAPVRRAGLMLLLSAWFTAARAAPEAVQLPSLDRTQAQALSLPARWLPSSLPGRRPALVLLHGCSGLWARDGQLGPRYQSMAETLNQAGVHVLLPDSLTPRGERSLCTQAVGGRRVTQVQRRRDALGALQWLAARDDVDASRLGLIGWSNGGSTVLAAINRRHPEVAAAPVPATLAVAFYPGCETERARGFTTTAALLLLLGGADDWTAAAPCQALAARADGVAPQAEVYDGAHHGFDGAGPVRLWREVPNGVNPGQGVHLGGNPAARDAAAARLARFLREQWGVAAKGVP